MIIRNKFNGYGFDGSRLCHDPVSLSIAATQAGVASSAAATAAAAAAAPAIAAPTLAAAGQAAALEAGKTAALESAKQGIIQSGTQQLGQQAAQQAVQQASQQGIAQVGQQALAQTGQQAATEAAKQSAVESAKQGIFSANPAGIPSTAAAPVTPPAGPLPSATPLPPAGSAPNTMSANLPNQGVMTDAGLQGPGVEILPPKPGMSVEQAQALNQQIGTRPPFDPAAQGQFNGLKVTPDKAFGPDSSGIYKGFDPITNAPYETATVPKFTPPAEGSMANIQREALPGHSKIFETFGTPPKNPLAKGFETGLQYVKDNPISTGLGLMSAGQYMNKPEKEDKNKYKNKVDMSGFQPSIPEQPSFTPSYEYQSYAVGGPVEQMAAQNSVGMNTGYPMAGINTPVYANPMIQRPEATNVIAPSADAGVGAYSGEPRFAEGGLSAAERREYGLRTRGQRAAQSLTKTYEEMEEERQREAMKLFNERPDYGIIRRSRTQELSSPFSAAMAEHARLAKKSKVPVVPMPKTNLGDIDTYMDIPLEAANGGIMHGLGGYSDGGRLLKGPGDGVSDSIPAIIGKKQPARLADGEFVIPARIVSELGNGSTEAGARKLYAMMERVQASRKKSIGKKKVAVNSKADKHLPA